MPRGLLLGLVGVAVAVGLVVALLWVAQRRLIYLGSTASVPSAETVLAGGRDVLLHTEDGLALGAWLVPSRNPDRQATVLVANGNAGDRALRAPLAAALAARGLGVLLFDYRGYGGNPGHPTESGLALDVRAAWRAQHPGQPRGLPAGEPRHPSLGSRVCRVGIVLAAVGLLGTVVSTAGQDSPALFLGLGAGGAERLATYPGKVWMFLAGLVLFVDGDTRWVSRPALPHQGRSG